MPRWMLNAARVLGYGMAMEKILGYKLVGQMIC
jgi:hypothetical protein